MAAWHHHSNKHRVIMGDIAGGGWHHRHRINAGRWRLSTNGTINEGNMPGIMGISRKEEASEV